ncbi:MAG: hypothetical protein SO366_02925 [Atopobiaceae bacterium]|nr:hypothetical protein [Atopobiaceae bacterium]
MSTESMEVVTTICLVITIICNVITIVLNAGIHRQLSSCHPNAGIESIIGCLEDMLKADSVTMGRETLKSWIAILKEAAR